MWRNYVKAIGGILFMLLLAGCSGTAGRQALTEDSVVPAELADAPPEVQQDYRAALARMEQKDDAAAASQLEQFVRLHPDYPGPYVNLAIIYDRQNRADEALWLLEKALVADPDSVYALNRIGLIKRQQGDFAAAEAAWSKATAVDPGYAYAWYNLGVLYDLYLQDLPAALDHYKRYQQVTGAENQDAMVSRWVTDLERRIGKPERAAQVREGQ